MSKRTGDPEPQAEEESKRAVPAIMKPLNMMEWIDNNKDSFVPPVCNKLMWVLTALSHNQPYILWHGLISMFFIALLYTFMLTGNKYYRCELLFNTMTDI
jgi:hypothetical protein